MWRFSHVTYAHERAVKAFDHRREIHPVRKRPQPRRSGPVRSKRDPAGFRLRGQDTRALGVGPRPTGRPDPIATGAMEPSCVRPGEPHGKKLRRPTAKVSPRPDFAPIRQRIFLVKSDARVYRLGQADPAEDQERNQRSDEEYPGDCRHRGGFVRLRQIVVSGSRRQAWRFERAALKTDNRQIRAA